MSSTTFDSSSDVRTHKQIGAPLRGHTNLTGRPNLVTDVAFNPHGRTLASASTDKTVRLWDVRTHKQIGAPAATRATSTA